MSDNTSPPDVPLSRRALREARAAANRSASEPTNREPEPLSTDSAGLPVSEPTAADSGPIAAARAADAELPHPVAAHHATPSHSDPNMPESESRAAESSAEQRELHDPTAEADSAAPNAHTAGENSPTPQLHSRFDAAPAHDVSATLSGVTASDSSRREQLNAMLATPAPKGTPPHTRPPRRRRWIGILITLVVLVGIGAGAVWAWTTYGDRIRDMMGWSESSEYGEGEATGEAFITIYPNDTGADVSTSLYEAGVTKSSDAFYQMLVATQQNPTFFPGVYKLQKHLSSEQALAQLSDPANKMSHAVQLREGLTEQQSLEIISQELDMPLDDLKAAAKPADYGVDADSLEGWIFPATYQFNPNDDAKTVIGAMVDRAKKALDEASVPEADRQKILTIASIIQREARSEDDFYKVSRVIQNRLTTDNPETRGKLQMDSTAQYGYGELHDGTASSSEEALNDDNPWNTYVHTGLPVGPISNPGSLAIDAALNPVDGPWYYFVTVNLDTGETVFTETYEEHQKAVAKWQEWCADNPDSGC